MRWGLMIGAVALAMLATRSATAQNVQNCHGHCRWSLIVRDASAGTQDLYPASDTREDCERIIAQFRTAHPERAADEMECVDDSRPDTWSHDDLQ
jgi:hypothetical protein